MPQAVAQPSTGRYGLSEHDARMLCDRALSLSLADHVRIRVRSGWHGFTRVATNRITSSGGSENVSMQIMSVFGKRSATISTNRLDDPALEQAVRRSEAMARLAPENPEYMPELGWQRYDKINAYYDSTGNMTPEVCAQAVTHVLRQARATDTVASGYIDVRAGAQAIASSGGLFAYHPSTGVASTMTVRTPEGDSSGWAGDQSNDWSKIDSEWMAVDAVRKCLDWRRKTSLDPGLYTVILEPTAVGMLMLRMLGTYDARRVEEGRSFFSRPGGGNLLNEKLFDSKITIMSHPGAPEAETAPFTVEGLPVMPKVWVEKGVLKKLSYSRFWAAHKGVAPCPAPSNLMMIGGRASLNDMISSTQRGVLISRFWSIRGLNPKTISYTGLTRDGTFLIENGKISRPVNNFRFNQSLVELLKNVEMMGAAMQVCAGEDGSVSMPIVVPAMKIHNFFLSSVSNAI